MTKEERFLLRLYEQALSQGDPESIQLRSDIGRQLGLSESVIKGICNQLCKANFTKKISEDEICMTPHGIRLAEALIS